MGLSHRADLTRHHNLLSPMTSQLVSKTNVITITKLLLKCGTFRKVPWVTGTYVHRIRVKYWYNCCSEFGLFCHLIHFIICVEWFNDLNIHDSFLANYNLDLVGKRVIR